MIKIGITGGIGSGKSVVATLLRLYGIPVYIADEESKRLTNSSPVIRRALVDLVGEAVYDGCEHAHVVACRSVHAALGAA